MPEHRVNGYFVMFPESTLRSEAWKGLKAYSRAVFTTMALRYDRKKGKEFITVWKAGSRWGAGTTYKMSSLYMDGEHIER